MIGINPSPLAVVPSALPEMTESEADHGLGRLADSVDCLEKCDLTDAQWTRARELLRRLKTALQEQDN